MSKARHGARLSEREGHESGRKREGLSRRELLKGAAGAVLAAAGASLAGALGGRAQNAGLYTSSLPPELPLPLGSLNYLDRKQYIHNMEIVSHLSGSTVSGGEPLMVMWAKGKQRLLHAGGGLVDIRDDKNPVVMNKGVIKGGGCVAYNTKLKKWIMMCTAAQPLTGAVPEYPHGQYDKELRDKVYAYLDCGWDDQLRLENHQRPFSNGIMIADLSDPSNVKEVSRWWVPGQRFGEEEEYKKYIFAGDKTSWTGNHGALSVPKRVEDGGTVGYGGFGAFGMYCMDLSDLKHPKPYGSVQYEFNAFGTIPFHTVLPVVSDAVHPRLQNLLVCTHEALEADCREVYHTPYVVDVKDPRNPKIVGFFPRPQAPPNAPYTDFCLARGRFGSHNTQCLVQPGSSKPNFVAMSWFNAGVRIFDISDPTLPKEVAWFVPPRDGDLDKYETWWRGTTENVFVEWDRNLIWIGTHEGTYCLSTPALGKPVLEPRKIEKWSLAHCNAGWDDQTARSFYFGRSLSQLG